MPALVTIDWIKIEDELVLAARDDVDVLADLSLRRHVQGAGEREGHQGCAKGGFLHKGSVKTRIALPRSGQTLTS